MTIDRQNLVARSLAALDDEGSIETRPLADIKADLEALGVDPSASIKAAHARARKRTSPADRLLARLDDADEAISDIDALENADISDIKKAVPEGVAASVAADAKKRAGVPSTMIRLKRPNRRYRNWGSSVVGLAACLLLFFIIRPDQLYQVEPSVIDDADHVGGRPQPATIVETELDKSSEVEEGLRLAEETMIFADEVVPPVEAEPEATTKDPTSASIQELQPSPIKPERPLARMKSLSVEGNEARAGFTGTEHENAQPLSKANKQSVQNRSITTEAPVAASALATPSSGVPSHKPMIKPSPAQRDADATKPAIDKTKPRTVQSVLAERDREAPSMTMEGGGWGHPEALHIVDPDAAPAVLKALARDLPKRRLIDRLDEAESLLGQRPVLALMTFLRDGEAVDVVVTSREEGKRVDLLNSFTDDADGTDQAFEIIDLPRSP